MRNSHRKVTFEMLGNQEMFEMKGLYDEIDILLYQSEAKKSIKMLKLIFD